MKKVLNIKPPLKHAFLAATAVVAFAITAGNTVVAAEPVFVDTLKPGTAVKLYNSPGDKEGVMDAPTLPLAVTGPSQHQFYPVSVNNRSYWVNGMDVKITRKAQVQCSQSAGVQSAATLGAATNRCK